MNAADSIQVQWAQWNCPANVKACTTLRHGGVSKGIYRSLNLGAHVGDDAEAVLQNRKRLKKFLNLPNDPLWLKQIHGIRVVEATHAYAGDEADGAITDAPGVVCAIMTADCLPLFLCDQAGSKVCVLHVGWRGLAAGIVEQGVKKMGVGPEQSLAWMGPAIGPDQFEIGGDVRERLSAKNNGAEHAFKPSGRPGHWLADLYGLTRMSLKAAGVRSIGQSKACTKSDAGSFFSHRRDGVCGRMASLIWLAVRQTD